MTHPERAAPFSQAESLGKTVIDVIDAGGVVRERYRFPVSKSPITVGRSLACDVAVDDPYAAPMHAILEVTPSGTVRVSDTGSLNGIVVDGTRHLRASGIALAKEYMQIGRSQVRVRTAEGELAEEKRDQEPPRPHLANPIVLAVLFGLGLAAHTVYEHWLSAPQDLLLDAAAGLFTPFAILGGWIAAWSLVTRIIRADWRFAQHAAIAFGVLLTHELVTEGTNFGVFVAGTRTPGGTAIMIGLAAIGLCLALHLRQASQLTPRKVTIAALLVPVLIGGSGLWIANKLDRLGGSSQVAMKLYPPNLRLTSPEPVADFFKRAPQLRAKADTRRAETARDAEN